MLIDRNAEGIHDQRKGRRTPALEECG